VRLALLSDIHSNLQAFEAVLEDIACKDITAVFSLGDNIGYGPQPQEVTDLIRQREVPSTMGNHEFALFSTNYYTSLNPTARKSIDITRRLMSREALDYAASLPPFRTEYGCRLVHGCPPHSLTRYLYAPSDQRLLRLFSLFPEPICFFGHTHNLALYAVREDGTIEKRRLKQEKITLLPGQRCIINIGSVGQPRDGNNNAKYAILDTRENSVEIRYVPYDIKETRQRLLLLGFPEFNARRLG